MADKVDFSHAGELPHLAAELINLRAGIKDLVGEEKKRHKQLIEQKQKEFDAEKDRIIIGKEYLGDLKLRKETEKEYTSVLKKLNDQLKELKISENERNLILRKASEDLRREGLKTDKILSSIGTSLGNLATKILGVTTIFAASIAIFDRMQAQRRFAMQTMGIGGQSFNPLNFNNTSNLLRYTSYGQMMGKSPQESLDYASNMAKEGFVTGRTKGNFDDIINISQAGMAIQSRYGIGSDAMTKIMHSLVFNLGMSSDKLGGAFVRLAKNVEGTNMNVPEFAENLAQLGPEFVKYGGSINDAVGIIRKFSDSLVKGTLNISNFSNAFSSRGTASTANEAGFYYLAKQFGVTLKGLSINSSDSALDIAGKVREWSQGKGRVEALQSAIQIADKMSSNMAGTSYGRIESMQLISNILPEIGSLFSNTPMSEQKKIIDLARSGKLTEESFNSLTGGTKKESDDLLKQQSAAYTATAGIKEMLDNVISGNAIRITDVLTDNVGKSVKDMGSWEGMKAFWENISSSKDIRGYSDGMKNYSPEMIQAIIEAERKINTGQTPSQIATEQQIIEDMRVRGSIKLNINGKDYPAEANLLIPRNSNKKQ